MSGADGLNRRHDSLLPGNNRLTARLPERDLTVFAYCPSSEPRGSLILFTGQLRDARSLRDKAVKLAQLSALTVFAPLLSKEEFPEWRYNRAGVIKAHRIQPRELWTGPLLQGLVNWARDCMDGDSLPTYLFGHSAGGQLLSRVCAYSPLTGVDRFVICSPSVYVAPTPDKPVPFGFRGIFDECELENRIRAYLDTPITIYLGKQDTGDRQLSNSEQAMGQGINRLYRGRHIFRMASKLADRRKWGFNWRLVETWGVGHSVKGMLDAPECFDALQFEP